MVSAHLNAVITVLFAKHFYTLPHTITVETMPPLRERCLFTAQLDCVEREEPSRTAYDYVVADT